MPIDLIFIRLRLAGFSFCCSRKLDEVTGRREYYVYIHGKLADTFSCEFYVGVRRICQQWINGDYDQFLEECFPFTIEEFMGNERFPVAFISERERGKKYARVSVGTYSGQWWKRNRQKLRQDSTEQCKPLWETRANGQ